MNISIKIETQISKEEYEKGKMPEVYTTAFNAHSEDDFSSIVDYVREYSRSLKSRNDVRTDSGEQN